jgi:hypothetical protein
VASSRLRVTPGAWAHTIGVYEPSAAHERGIAGAPMTTVLDPSSRMDTSPAAGTTPHTANAPFAPRRVVLLLGAFFLALYALTMSGHFTSPDEEIMYQVARSMAELRGFGIGGAGGSTFLAVPGADGALYGPYGVVPSALGVPAYLVGRSVAAALPPRYAEVVPRFFFAMDDAVLSALTCVLVYLFAYRLGYGNRIAILVSLGFGVGTLAWAYSKYAWSEPVTALFLVLAVWAAYETTRASSWRWALVSGLAVGLAIGSKITAALVVPVIVGYLLLANPSQGLGVRALRRVLPFLAPLAGTALLIGLFDLVRFGSMLNTGYNLDSMNAVLRVWPPVGIAGLLVSPGKSLFLYSPLALLGVIGWAVLVERRTATALMLALIVLSQVLAVGVLAIWSGDLAWGPRYLVPITALLVLPAGALLRWAGDRVFEWAFIGLLGVGVLINLGAVLLDQRAGYDSLVRSGVRSENLERLRYWNPATSPIVLNWQLLGARYAQRFQSGQRPVVWLDSGTGGGASAPSVPKALLPRWTGSTTRFTLSEANDPLVFRFAYTDFRTAAHLPPADVVIKLDGQTVPEDHVVRRHDDVYLWIVFAYLEGLQHDPHQPSIELDTTTWVPAQAQPGSTDGRALGIQLEDARAWSNEQFLPLAESPAPPLPVSDAEPWSFVSEEWFYVPTTHLADVWLWYLGLSGLPRALVLLGLIPAIGLVTSGWLLVRDARVRQSGHAFD